MASLFGFKRILAVDRYSCLEMFGKKGILKNFAKFTRKKNVWESATLSKKKI